MEIKASFITKTSIEIQKPKDSGRKTLVFTCTYEEGSKTRDKETTRRFEGKDATSEEALGGCSSEVNYQSRNLRRLDSWRMMKANIMLEAHLSISVF